MRRDGTGQLVGAALLDHYRETLLEIRQIGYATYAARQLRPYVVAAVSQFSQSRRTLTQRFLERWERTGPAEDGRTNESG